MNNQVFYNNEFINLYTKDNPILEVGCACYCIIFNTTDYHKPIVCECLVTDSKFVDGLNTVYNVKIQNVIESPVTINNFVLNRQFVVYESNKKATKTLVSKSVFNTLEFPVNAFFVRKTIEQINEVKNLYCSIVEQDLKQMISQIYT